MKNKFLLFGVLIVFLISCKKKEPITLFSFDCSTGITTNIIVAPGSYLIDCQIFVDNAVLTLSPGVTLKFTGNGELTTTNGGAINAEGTAASPIIFTGTESIPGYWYGIDILTNSLNNSFKYCQFSYGGKSQGSGPRSIVWVGDGSAANNGRALFQNCTFSFGLKNGLYCAGNSFIDGSVNNIFTSNTEYPVSVELGSVSQLSGTNTYLGNGKDYINVSDTYQYSGDATFNKLDVPYYLLATVNDKFELSGDIVVKPGTTLVMGPNMELEIESNGSFNCEGTSAENITIKGLEDIQGYWDKIRFLNTPSSSNIFDYAIIKNGGSTSDNIWNDNGMITCCAGAGSGNNHLTIRHSTIQKSQSFGLHFKNCSTAVINGVSGATTIEGKLLNWTEDNTFGANALGDIYTSD